VDCPPKNQREFKEKNCPNSCFVKNDVECSESLCIPMDEKMGESLTNSEKWFFEYQYVTKNLIKGKLSDDVDLNKRHLDVNNEVPALFPYLF